jgi:uncharacterized protein YdiU (UPF0061 family)
MTPTSTPLLLELKAKDNEAFYDPVKPAEFPQALPRYQNQAAAEFLNLRLTPEEWEKYFHRFEPYPGNLPSPLALRYHGHQFGHYNPELGDGRGFVYAQFLGKDHKIYDLGTKGSGQTPYSRFGDGRLTLKGAVREALATEMLESLGVFTSKTFCFFETGESLQRQDEPSPTRAAVLTRMSLSHWRIGSFQRLAYLGQAENLKRLVAYSAEHYFPELWQKSSENLSDLVTSFFSQVSHNLATLAAQYMMTGFVHGVLNSDNMNITGESFDYGPYRFLPTYEVNFTAAYFDSAGFYCFGRQPTAIQWNVLQLGLSLQRIFPDLPIEEVLRDYTDTFNAAVERFFLQRLNLAPEEEEKNRQLLREFFIFLEKTQAPFEQVFFDLFGGLKKNRWQNSPLASLYAQPEFQTLRNLLLHWPVKNEEQLNHRYFAQPSPCTLLIEEVEKIWAPIAEKDDWSFFNAKLEQIRAWRDLYQLI